MVSTSGVKAFGVPSYDAFKANPQRGSPMLSLYFSNPTIKDDLAFTLGDIQRVNLAGGALDVVFPNSYAAALAIEQTGWVFFGMDRTLRVPVSGGLFYVKGHTYSHMEIETEIAS